MEMIKCELYDQRGTVCIGEVYKKYFHFKIKMPFGNKGVWSWPNYGKYKHGLLHPIIEFKYDEHIDNKTIRYKLI